MGRPKSKPRAQRKFAQGAFVPPQNQPPTSSTTVLARFHRSVNSPGPVTYNNCSAKDMLTLMSLGKVHPHLNLNPVVELEYDRELALKAESTVKKRIKVKKRSKENNNDSVEKKKYELRNRPRKRHRSVSDSGEDMPLSFLAGDLCPSPVKTRAVDGRTARRDQPLLARPTPASVGIVTGSNHTQNGSAHSDCSPPSNLSKRLTRPVKRKVNKAVTTKRRTIGIARRKRLLSLRSVFKSASELDSVTIVIDDDDTKQDPIASLQQTAELITNHKISTGTSVNPESTNSEQTDSGIPINIAPKRFMATPSASCSTANDSTPFELPNVLVTRTKSNKINCACHLLTSLQELLNCTSGKNNYCYVCKRCELLSKYEKVFSMLPVSDDNEPDILVTFPRDVYDFDSDDEGLKFLRRGRELVRNVLTTKRLPIWLSNLEMTLKKTMFLDANKLGTLKRNISLEKDDVTVNKIITRIDYLNQCLMEDTKELDAVKTKRKSKATIITRIDNLNQCLMEDKKELDAVKTKRKSKATINTRFDNLNQCLMEDKKELDAAKTKRKSKATIITRIDNLNQCLMDDKKELDAVKTKRKSKATIMTRTDNLNQCLMKDKKELDAVKTKRKSKATIMTRTDNLNQCLMEDKKELDAAKTKRKSKATKNVVAVAGRNRSKKIKWSDDSQPLLRVRKYSRPKQITLVDPANTTPIPKTIIKENDASCSQSKLIDLQVRDCDSLPLDDSKTTLKILQVKSLSSPPAEGPAEAPSGQISSERRHLVLRLTPLEIEQSHVTSRTKKTSYKKVNSNGGVPVTNKPDNLKGKPLKTQALKDTFCREEMLVYSEQNLENKFIPMEKLTYRPTLNEFQDPINYITKIKSTASQYGICKIIPPEGFFVPCHLDDNSMFTTINQYLGRLFQRWGPTTRELTSIQTYVTKIANARERDQFTKSPLFDGVELDLVKLYHVVLEHGGIEELLAHSERWAPIAEEMCLVSPRGKPDHKKLEKLYCKHVLPYESLSRHDRERILRKVDRVWAERYRCLTRRAMRPLLYQKRMLGECDSDSDDPPVDAECEDVRTIGKLCFDRIEECTAKGRTMNLNTYRRLASQIQAMRFPPGSNPTTEQIEDAYWKILSLRNEHLCVLSAYIDTAVDKLGHTSNRDGPGGNHPWNLKRLGENYQNVLSFLGKTLSVTNPTLSLNQLYSTNCWHKDPHLLAWMDYMHEGTTKIWYAVSENDSGLFREAMEHLAPFAVQKKGIWLASDTTMVPPGMLLAKDVKLQRIEQNPGEFIVVFPGAYASSIATGLTISESIYFEDKEWVCSIDQIFQQMREDYEPGMFSNIVLLFRMARDPSVSQDVMPSVLKSVEAIIASELEIRREAAELKFAITLVKPDGDRGPVSWPNQEECSICRAPLILSKTVRFNEHRLLMCLKHGVQLYKCAPVEDRDEPPPVTLIYTEEKLMETLDFVRRRASGEDVFEVIEVIDIKEVDVTLKVEEYVEENNTS